VEAGTLPRFLAVGLGGMVSIKQCRLLVPKSMPVQTFP